MRRVRSKDTKPELIVRKTAYKLGYRYRLHRKELPGTPDLAFIGRKKVIFVHGCFWHQHKGCAASKLPSSNKEFWSEKLKKNIDRDRHQLELLKSIGWGVLVIWECQTKDQQTITSLITNFLTD